MYYPIDCKVPEQPSNGILKLAVDGVTTFGAKASVSCNAGYELVGDVYVRCRADGVWSSLPSCNFKGICLFKYIIYTYYIVRYGFCCNISYDTCLFVLIISVPVNMLGHPGTISRLPGLNRY